MTIEEIDLYWLKAEDLVRYLPEGDSSTCGANSWTEYAQVLVDKKARAADCSALDGKLAEAIDGVLSVGIHLPESDPMQEKVEERLFEYGSPDADSPVILTSNSKLTHQILKLIFDAAKVRAFVVPVDTNGYTLDNAVAAGAFSPMAVMKALTDSGIAGKVSGRRAIIPGLAVGLKGNIERITRWSLEVGPVSGFELPLYLLGR